jgi:sugar lactone lactonase YvrE
VKVYDGDGALRGRWATDFPGTCVAVRDDATVFVGGEGRIATYSSAGKAVDLWTDPDRLGRVTAIDFADEHILVADAADRCIRRFDRNRRWLNDIGKAGNTKGFMIPNGHLDFSVDDEGIIHVCNPAAHRVERYTLDGEKIGQFGRFGVRQPEDFPGCCNPTNLALSPEGHVVVTEKAAPRLKIYDAEGKLRAYVGPEAFDANCKNMDVAVDAEGRIYVVDTVRLQICVFAVAGDPATPAEPVPAIGAASP